MTEKENTRLPSSGDIQGSTLAQCVTQSLENYFTELDGHDTADLYQLVLSEVEKPLLETVMKYADGNQSRASAMLGISRSTLRKKLHQHNLA